MKKTSKNVTQRAHVHTIVWSWVIFLVLLCSVDEEVSNAVLQFEDEVVLIDESFIETNSPEDKLRMSRVDGAASPDEFEDSPKDIPRVGRVDESASPDEFEGLDSSASSVLAICNSAVFTEERLKSYE